LTASTGDHQPVLRDGSAGCSQYEQPLLFVHQNKLAVGAEDNVTTQLVLVPPMQVLSELLLRDLSIAIKGCWNGRIDSS